MSGDKMREEFEVWILSEYPNQHMGKFADDEYHSTTIQHCWLAWQASRAVLVERPEDFTDGGNPSARILIAHHRQIVGRWISAIEAAGLKVKP